MDFTPIKIMFLFFLLITVVSNHIELYTLYTIIVNYYASYDVPLIGNKKLEFDDTKGVMRKWTENTMLPLPPPPPKK